MTRILAVPSAAKALGARSGFDAVVLVGHDLAAISAPELTPLLRTLAATDAAAASAVNVVPAPGLAGSRLVTAPTGPISRDHDDVRRYAEAAQRGMRRARDAGSRKPLLLLQQAPEGGVHEQFARVAALAAAGSLWEPLEAREARGKAITPIEQIGTAVLGGTFGANDAAWVEAVDGGLALARDLSGTDPERMAPPRFAAYVRAALKGLPVEVAVQQDRKKLQKDYPLLMAVARASLGVARHRPNVVRLEYSPKGRIRHTLLFAGKGLTYDTGGADLKTGGVMAGMSRDKGGAAAIAGLFFTVAKLRVPGVRLVAELGVVRNSIGSDAFVSDEIVTSHAGCRVRIGNTDAEGRLVLADLLSHLRIDAAKATAPRLFSVATLTGHAGRAVGPYNIALDNGPARTLRTAETLAEIGDQCGDPFEVSRLRREDFDLVQPRSKADDVLSCNNAPSSATARGHQFPMAFLCLASGLAKHGGDGVMPLPFTHIDIGGSGVDGGDWQHGRPSGRPLVALFEAFCS